MILSIQTLSLGVAYRLANYHKLNLITFLNNHNDDTRKILASFDKKYIYNNIDIPYYRGKQYTHKYDFLLLVSAENIFRDNNFDLIIDSILRNNDYDFHVFICIVPYTDDKWGGVIGD